MKKSLLAPILCILFALPVLIHAQEPTSCDFNYGTYTEYTPVPVISSSPAIGLIAGKIYLAGGSDFTNYENIYTPDHLQIYDPETDSWDTTGARLPVPRSIYGGGDMALDGKLYAIGGIDWVNLGGGDWQMIPHARMDVYDPQSDTWELKANLPIPIGGKAVCSLNDKLYVTGGVSADQVLLNSLLCYDPGTDQWTELSGMETPRLFHVSVALDGKIYVISGSNSEIMTATTNTCEVYDPDLDQWTSIAPLPGPSNFGAACVVDGEIYVFGGSPTGPANPSRRVYKYDPEMDTWIEIDYMKTPSKEHVLVPIGRTIYMFGLSPANTGFVHSYELSDIRLDAMIPDDTISGDELELELSAYFNHVDAGGITYSVCIDEPGVVEASIDGSMLTVTGLMPGDAEVSILAESGEDNMGDVFQVYVEPSVGIEGICEIPPALNIYPNPARGTTTLQYSVQFPGMVRLEIYDMLGKRKAILFNEYMGFGYYEFQYSTHDWESGVYFCNLETANEKVTIKFIVEH